jgi:hypothetical protein
MTREDAALGNEREWRKFLMSEIKDLRHEVAQINITVTTLKIKIGLASSFFGFLAGALATVISKKL